ncbi:Conjugated polyketone reducatse C2, putative [Candida maltosa Xu316]|uniref:Conjugated polyketone reducatse C2, putative n=1 Tax=Candida maltosa (strain Xu316) TaxID=1245528 RepID=M3HR86_CANMX|nr:Conjugated polyketone reducatse C2, putative [Candida maltosa Xu316]
MTGLTTVSGDPITIGVGSGSSVKDLKRKDPSEENKKLITDVIKFAIHNGFNHIDTAEAYTTQPEVGDAIKGFPREKLWITTKYVVSSTYFQKKSFTPTDFIKQSFEELGTDYIDLFLIHVPPKDESLYTLESLWEEFIEIQKTGKVRYIGVSNHNVDHLKRILSVSQKHGVFPIANQIKYYVGSEHKDIVKFSKENNILIEAYGPLTPLRAPTPNSELDAILVDLEKKYNATKAQILLRALIDQGILPITASFKNYRLEEAIQTYKFELEPEDIKRLESI